MTVPSYGAAPLAKTFLFLRALSLIAMVAIVGMTANFVAEIVSADVTPPHEVIATLVITCIATLYALISVPFFYARAHLGLFIMAGLDAALSLAFVVVGVKLGEPVSYLNCMAIATVSASANAKSAASFIQSLASDLGTDGNMLGLSNWAGSTRTNCFETKAIWGLCIALCILFTSSALILPTLWYKAKKADAGRGAKAVV